MKKTHLIILGIIAAISLLVFFILIPAFAGRLQINPAIDLGSFEIRWYGIIMALAILTSYFIARKYSWKFGISKNDIDDYSFWIVMIGFLGARAYYVLFNLDYFSKYPQEIYKVWHGGLAIYGAVIAGLLFTYFYANRKAYTFWHLLDLVALSLPLGQAIGRIGNFINQEAYGTPTELPWKMFVASKNRIPEYYQYQYFHPAFLYEIILNLIVFGILYKILGKTKSGVLGLIYLAAYSLGRFFIEGIRLDSFFVKGFRVDQVIAFLLVVIAGYCALKKQSSALLKR
jgi:phosphatidylglycerol:prolipoprotein diacylglycerol transferase